MKNFEKGISVVICCYNSRPRLEPTLAHLAAQQTRPELFWEIIIVDNHSTDGTAEFAREVWQSLGCTVPFQIVVEPKQGIVFAREKGIATAASEYLLFCDDDNWLCPDYVQIAFDCMEKHPKIGALGGRHEAVSDVPFPVWFTTFQGDYAVGVQGLESGNITERGFLWTAGMTMRQSVMRRIKAAGGESTLVGRQGKQLTSGEDSEWCFWLRWAGYELWYDDRLVLKHYLPAPRLTTDYYRRLKTGHNEAQKTLNIYEFIRRNDRPDWVLLLFFGFKFLLNRNKNPLQTAFKILKNRSAIRKIFL